MTPHLKGRIGTGTQTSADNGNGVQAVVLHLAATGTYHIRVPFPLPLQPQNRFAASSLDAWLEVKDAPEKLFQPGNVQAQKGARSSTFCGSRCPAQSELNRSHSAAGAPRGYEGLIRS